MKKVTTSLKNPFFSCATIFIKLNGYWNDAKPYSKVDGQS